MYGRYGTDQFNFFLIICALIVDFFGMIISNGIVMIVADALLVFVIFRSFSKNINKRAMENRGYLEKTAGIRRTFSAMKKNSQDKEHRYYVCPHCHQLVRVPRGRGKLTITCPSCGTQFDRKS